MHELPNVATSTRVRAPDGIVENLHTDHLELDRHTLDEIAATTRRGSAVPPPARDLSVRTPRA
jgi:hypothetical protein